MAANLKFFDDLGSLGDDGVSYLPSVLGATVSMTLINDPTGAGYGQVGRFALSAGDKRCELSGHVDRDPAIGTDYWTWTEFYIPPDWVSPSMEIIVYQVHEQSDTAPADVVGRAQLIVGVSGNRVRIQNAYHAATQTVALSQITNRVLCDWPLADSLGRWTSIVTRTRWGTNNDGSIEVYRNRRRIFAETGRSNAYNNAVARGGNEQGYHKIGVYNDTSAVLDRPLHVLQRGIRRGLTSEFPTYNAFMAGCGSALTELEPQVFSRGAMA